jgi:L-threonylcarbamoyladenylate synthase
MNAKTVGAGEVLLAFGAVSGAVTGARVTLNLSPERDLRKAASNLFAMLRTLDRSGARSIAVMPIPETGLGEAINDRLRRASVPRNDS